MDEYVWNNRHRKQQVINFTGLARGKLMPCDLDAVTEWRNMGYVFIEAKYKDAPMPEGQRLMYVRMADDLDRAGKPTLFIVAEHDQTDTEKDIDLSQCKVRFYYYQGFIDGEKNGKTVEEVYNAFIDYLEKKRGRK